MRYWDASAIVPLLALQDSTDAVRAEAQAGPEHRDLVGHAGGVRLRGVAPRADGQLDEPAHEPRSIA